METAGAFNSASKLAIVGYAEEANARTEQSTKVEFEAIPFECVVMRFVSGWLQN